MKCKFFTNTYPDGNYHNRTLFHLFKVNPLRMKKLLLILPVIFMSVHVFSQEYQSPSKVTGKFSTGMDVFTDFWQGVPDSVSTKPLNLGTSFYVLYNNPIGKSNFSFAFGLGITAHNLKSNSLIKVDTTGGLSISKFYKIPSKVDGNSIKYKRNKLTVAYLDIPMEFRYKTKNEMKFALGFKLGFLVGSHTKYKGDNLETGTESYKIKQSDIKNLENMSYGVTGQIGYKWINLVGCYSLSNLFKNDKGPDIYPISIGVALRPF